MEKILDLFKKFYVENPKIKALSLFNFDEKPVTVLFDFKTEKNIDEVIKSLEKSKISDDKIIEVELDNITYKFHFFKIEEKVYFIVIYQSLTEYQLNLMKNDVLNYLNEFKKYI